MGTTADFRKLFNEETDRLRDLRKARAQIAPDDFERAAVAALRNAAALVVEEGDFSDVGQKAKAAVEKFISLSSFDCGDEESSAALRELEAFQGRQDVIAAQLMKPAPKNLPLSTVPVSDASIPRPVKTWADRDPVSGKLLIISKFHDSLSPNELTDFDLKLIQVLRNASGGMDEVEVAKRLGCKPDVTFKERVGRLVRMGRIQSSD